MSQTSSQKNCLNQENDLHNESDKTLNAIKWHDRDERWRKWLMQVYLVYVQMMNLVLSFQLLGRQMVGKGILSGREKRKTGFNFCKKMVKNRFQLRMSEWKRTLFYGKIVSFPRDNIMFAWRLSSKKELSETKQKKSLNKLMKDCKTNKCGFNSVTVWSISALALFQSSVIHSNTMAKKQENRPDNQRDVSKARILVNAQEGNDKRVEGRHFLDSNFSRKGMW